MTFKQHALSAAYPAMSDNDKTQVTVVETDAVVMTMHRARLALAEAKTIQETKRIVDAAAAAEIYARRQKLGEEAEDLAASIKVEALRKLGEMLQAIPRAKGARAIGGDSRSGGSISVPPENDTPTLAELGLTKKESAVAQKLAALPDESFAQVRDGHVTVAKAIAAVDAARAARPKTRASTERTLNAKAEPAPGEHEANDAELLDVITDLSAENETLRDRLAVVAMDASDEEKRACADLIAELRTRVRHLEAELDAVASSRNGLLVENAELKKSVAYWRRKAGVTA